MALLVVIWRGPSGFRAPPLVGVTVVQVELVHRRWQRELRRGSTAQQPVSATGRYQRDPRWPDREQQPEGRRRQIGESDQVTCGDVARNARADGTYQLFRAYNRHGDTGTVCWDDLRGPFGQRPDVMGRARLGSVGANLGCVTGRPESMSPQFSISKPLNHAVLGLLAVQRGVMLMRRCALVSAGR